MNYIYNFSQKLINQYYQNIYDTFLNEKENQYFLIINQNYYNPLNNYNHYLKKYKSHFYIVSHCQDFSNSLKNETQHDECSEYVNFQLYSIDQILNEFEAIKFNIIIIFHIPNLGYLENILNISLYYKCTIHIYVSLSNKSSSFKNKYRLLLKNMNFIELGYVFLYPSFIEFLENNSSYDIVSIQSLEDHHYAFYGSHKNYKITLHPKSK